jgi:hypothetical protein
MIIAISGKAGAGKTFLANAIMHVGLREGLFDGTESMLNFADPLKKDIAEGLDIDPKLMYGSQEDKMTLTLYKWSNMPGVLVLPEEWKDSQYFNSLPGVKVMYGDQNMTIRDIMEYYGTDIMRRINNDVWVNKFIKNAQRYRYVIAPDLRFKNEFEAVQKNGGFTIRLAGGDTKNTHISNTDLDGVLFDYAVKYKERTEEAAYVFAERIIEILKEKESCK